MMAATGVALVIGKERCRICESDTLAMVSNDGGHAGNTSLHGYDGKCNQDLVRIEIKSSLIVLRDLLEVPRHV